MATVMTTYGDFGSAFPPVVGRISLTNEVAAPNETVLITDGPVADPTRFAAILIGRESIAPPRGTVGRFDNLDHLKDGDIVLIDGKSGRTRTLYRANSFHNSLYVTDLCDNRCIMCSQPPHERDDGGPLAVAMRTVALLKSAPPTRLGITGGEPTMLGDGLIRLLTAMATDLPETTVTCLSNGRGFADARVAEAVAAVGNRSLRFSIPIHGDVPEVHDHIAQAKGALRETVAGLYNLENNGVESEIRIVLHARSIPRLTQTAEFIRRKLPFVRQIALMGMENTGYATMNWSDLWIDPIDYRDILTSAVRTLHRHGMDVSIYNIPLCVLAEDVRGFARRSISDHKQVLVAECDGCQVAEHCAGFFASCVERHSRAIKPTRLK